MAKFFATQTQIPIPIKYLGFGYKGLVFCRNDGGLMEKTDIGNHSTKMGVDQLDKDTPNAPKFIYPKVWDFDEKRLRWASVIRAFWMRCNIPSFVKYVVVHGCF